ncbi:hypothetical protein BDP27DRAFT_1338354 [Rhodocollybia butyracea]|uniref:Uncharacterized protein n=1 Tax=Rhodocollybia butyracea TaxID=206335 RepID=A0A9P5TZ94_9AGAR|nr:hypothetical protein BDP27DRAFT_1338354 [Rhodocollybia butyracea]
MVQFTTLESFLLIIVFNCLIDFLVRLHHTNCLPPRRIWTTFLAQVFEQRLSLAIDFLIDDTDKEMRGVSLPPNGDWVDQVYRRRNELEDSQYLFPELFEVLSLRYCQIQGVFPGMWTEYLLTLCYYRLRSPRPRPPVPPPSSALFSFARHMRDRLWQPRPNIYQ